MNFTPEIHFWQKDSWLQNASAWINEQLSILGAFRVGPLSQPHTRPWSTVLHIPTSIGPLYFKAAAPALKHEVAITKTLADWFPDLFLPVLAAELEQGWLLLPDGGGRLREILKIDQDLTRWETILTRYAELQIHLANRSAELLALGAPDRRLEQLPSEISRLLADEAGLLIDQTGGLNSQQLTRLKSLQPRLVELCQTLAEFPIPASLNHGDFHDGNIFIQADRTLFFDWGDCSLSQPFFSLRTVSVSLENTLGIEENTPEFKRLLDAYLEPWGTFAPRSELRLAFELSHRLAPLCSALSWDHIVSATPAALRGEAIFAVPALLAEFLELNPDFYSD